MTNFLAQLAEYQQTLAFNFVNSLIAFSFNYWLSPVATLRRVVRVVMYFGPEFIIFGDSSYSKIPILRPPLRLPKVVFKTTISSVIVYGILV